MLLGGSDDLDGYEFVTTLLEAGDDVSNETTLFPFVSILFLLCGCS
jgi:hypothetical protein